MKKILSLLIVATMSAGCAGITDVYSVPQNTPKARVRIALENTLDYPGSGRITTANISDLNCSNVSSLPGFEVRPTILSQSMFATSANIAERTAKAEKMAQEEKPVLDFINSTGIAVGPSPSSSRYVFDVEAEKTHVFHFAYTKQPGRHFSDRGETCTFKKAYKFAPNETAEIRFRVLYDTSPTSCQVVAVSLLGDAQTPFVIPKPSEEFRMCP